MLLGEPTSRTEDKGVALALKLIGTLHGAGEKRITQTVEGEWEVIDETRVLA
jgi:hypothetical protein